MENGKISKNQIKGIKAQFEKIDKLITKLKNKVKENKTELDLNKRVSLFYENKSMSMRIYFDDRILRNINSISKKISIKSDYNQKFLCVFESHMTNIQKINSVFEEINQKILSILSIQYTHSIIMTKNSKHNICLDEDYNVYENEAENKSSIKDDIIGVESNFKKENGVTSKQTYKFKINIDTDNHRTIDDYYIKSIDENVKLNSLRQRKEDKNEENDYHEVGSLYNYLFFI